MIRFREADRADVPQVVALLRDDMLGQSREADDMSIYLTAFDGMQKEGGNRLIVGEDGDGAIVATYQITLISGLSLRAARRAQIESVRVASHLRGQGVGEAMFADAQARARAADCSRIRTISWALSGERIVFEVTSSEPRTARTWALRILARRSSAARMPPTPTAKRNCSTLKIR